MANRLFAATKINLPTFITDRTPRYSFLLVNELAVGNDLQIGNKTYNVSQIWHDENCNTLIFLSTGKDNYFLTVFSDKTCGSPLKVR